MKENSISMRLPEPSFHRLGSWLFSKSEEDSFVSKIQYHLLGRVALLTGSLFALAKAVVRLALGSIAYFCHLLTMGYWDQIQAFSAKQIEKGVHAKSASFSCFLSIVSPQQLTSRLEDRGLKAFYLVYPPSKLTPDGRSRRIKLDRIQERLDHQFARAQNQARKEIDKSFSYVDAPDSFNCQSSSEKVSGYEVGVCHAIGRRSKMEDTHLTASFDLTSQGQIYPVQLFGIFDGHGGKEAANYVRENLERLLHETLEEFCAEGLTNAAIWNSLKITFAKLNAGFDGLRSGTTAVVSIVLDRKVWSANVGDSRAIVDGKQVTEDAKPTDPYYQNGIRNRGDEIEDGRINRRLGVARAVGDRNIGEINPRPKITVRPFNQERSWLMLCCDGIPDVSSTRQIVAAVHKQSRQTPVTIARNIVYSAYEAGSKDNLSVMFVKNRKCS